MTAPTPNPDAALLLAALVALSAHTATCRCFDCAQGRLNARKVARSGFAARWTQDGAHAASLAAAVHCQTGLITLAQALALSGRAGMCLPLMDEGELTELEGALGHDRRPMLAPPGMILGSPADNLTVLRLHFSTGEYDRPMTGPMPFVFSKALADRLPAGHDALAARLRGEIYDGHAAWGKGARA